MLSTTIQRRCPSCEVHTALQALSSRLNAFGAMSEHRWTNLDIFSNTLETPVGKDIQDTQFRRSAARGLAAARIPQPLASSRRACAMSPRAHEPTSHGGPITPPHFTSSEEHVWPRAPRSRAGKTH